jgi:hypothetical protein
MNDEPTYDIVEGAYVYHLPGRVDIIVDPTRPDRWGNPWITASAAERKVYNGHLAPGDLKGRELFHAHALGLNGSVNWLGHLAYVCDHYLTLTHASGGDAGSVWQRAISAPAFVAQQEVELKGHVADLVYPGCLAVVAAPKYTGKSLVALMLGVAASTGSRFRGEQLETLRVLYVDRDNPVQIIRSRLHRIGVLGAEHFKLLTRVDAPPLTDRRAWLALPWQDYDVVIVDSIGSATEGVSEKEGRETQKFLATLKDLAARELAMVLLDNTNKAGENYRGRGEKADAVDILYEARDLTGWTPSKREWWEDLPEAGAHAWASRATRHQAKTTVRVGFVCAKFRPGPEPLPFVLEIDFQGEYWTLQDVTEHLTTQGEDTARETARAERQKLERAAQALAAELKKRAPEAPMVKRDAEAFLQAQGLTRKQARHLLEEAFNADVYPKEGLWVLRLIAGEKRQGVVVSPLV